MEIQIISRNFAPTAPIRDHVEFKLARLLAWNRREIDHVVVTLGDTNGPTRGGEDKYCRIAVTLVGGAVLCVEHVSLDLYQAVSRATARLERAVQDELSRRRRSRPRRSLAAMWN